MKIDLYEFYDSHADELLAFSVPAGTTSHAAKEYVCHHLGYDNTAYTDKHITVVALELIVLKPKGTYSFVKQVKAVDYLEYDREDLDEEAY